MKYPALLAAILVLLSACSIVSSQERTLYAIDPTTVLPRTQNYSFHDVTLHIAAPRAVLGLNSDHIQVQTEDGHITSVNNAAWIVAPDKMLEPILIRAFEGAHLFANVVDDFSTADASYQLQTTIERFTLVQSSREINSDPPRVEIALRATVIKLPENKLLLSKLITTTEPVDPSHMSNVLSAYEKALSHCLSDLIEKTNSGLTNSRNRL